MAEVVLLCRVDGNFGGVERYILTLVCGLDKTLFQPVIVGLGKEGELIRQARQLGFDTEFIPMVSRFNIFHAARELERIAQKREARIIHTFGLRSNTAAWLMHRQSNMPWIVRLPNHNATDYNNPIRGWLSHRANNFLIRQANALQVISPNLEAIVRGWKKTPKSIYTIFNGVDTTYYSPSQYKRDVRSLLSIPEKAIVIGSVGRLDNIKGYDHLIRVFARVAQHWIDSHLVIVGDGPERDKLLQLGKELQIQNQIHFPGYCEDVRPYLKTINLYVCSSHSEGVSNSLLEAMSFGIPVVSTRVGGIESVIEEGISGFLVPPNEEEILWELIQELLTDQNILQSIGENARSRIENHFSVQQMVENVQHMYNEVIANNACPQ